MMPDQAEPTAALPDSAVSAEPATSEPVAAISATTVPQTINQGADTSGMITKVVTPDTVIVIERSETND